MSVSTSHGQLSVGVRSLKIDISQLSATAGETIKLPILIQDLTGVTDLSLAVNYPSQYLTVTDVLATDLTQSDTITKQLSTGSVTIDLTRFDPSSVGTGEFLELEMILAEDVSQLTSVDLILAESEINSGLISVIPSSGLVNIQPSAVLNLSDICYQIYIYEKK